MLIAAAHTVVLAQLQDPSPEPPPGTEHSMALLRYLLWFHLLAAVLAAACWARFARRLGSARARVWLLIAVALAVGISTAAVGAYMGTALE